MNKKYFVLSSIPLLITLLTTSVSAATYHVDKNYPGASDSNSGTDPTQPFLTIARAVCGSQDCINSPNASLAAHAGDTVIVQNGTYYQTRTDNTRYLPVLQPANSGTAGSPITIKAASQYGVTITYANGVSGRGPLIGAYNRSYIIWDGFTVREVAANNASDTGPVVIFGNYPTYSTHITVQNCDLIGVQVDVADNHNVIRVEVADSIVIYNNKIHGVNYSFNSYLPALIMTYAANNLIIEHNEIYNSAYGIYPKGGKASGGIWGNHNVTVRYNLIHDVKIGIKTSFTGQSDFYQNIFYNIQSEAMHYGESCNNLDCSANTIYSDFPGMANVDVDFYNNTIYNAHQGITFYSLPDRALGGGTDFRNNIIVLTTNTIGSDNNTNGGAYITYRNFKSDYGLYYTASGTNFRFAGTNQTITQWRSSTSWSSYPSGYDVHARTSDPLFVNPAAYDFHLQANSPARLAGTAFGNILGGGTSAAINIGAYVTGSELIGLTSQSFSSTAPTPPQNLAVR
jgi:hypothetical protein